MYGASGGGGLRATNTLIRTHTLDVLVPPPLLPTTADSELVPMARPASGLLQSGSLLNQMPIRASLGQPLPADWSCTLMP